MLQLFLRGQSPSTHQIRNRLTELFPSLDLEYLLCKHSLELDIPPPHVLMIYPQFIRHCLIFHSSHPETLLRYELINYGPSSILQLARVKSPLPYPHTLTQFELLIFAKEHNVPAMLNTLLNVNSLSD